MSTEILVSVYCMTYNHAKYIKSALEGFVNQKTNFRYEVLVHDDASTDGTTEIIREYEKKYPDIIKPIFQTENQYSKKTMIFNTFIYPKMKGKYIAMCEGDDFWIDEYKLQKQVDYMESHEDCSFCFTNAFVEDIEKKGARCVFVPYLKSDSLIYDHNKVDYTVNDMAAISFIPTASFMYRRKLIDIMPPSYFERYPAGDRKLSLFMSAVGYAHFINQVTCIYRKNVGGSVMTKWKSSDVKQQLERIKGFLRLYQSVYDFVKYINKQLPVDNIIKAIDEHKKQILILSRDKSIAKEEDYNALYKEFSLKDKIAYRLIPYMPSGVYAKLREIKRNIKNKMYYISMD